MTAIVVLLVALLSISALLASALLVAWHNLGRPRHAITWMASNIVLAVAWTAALFFILFDPANPLNFTVINGLVMVSSALLLIGFRQRADLAPRAGLLLGAALLTTLLIAFSTFLFPYAAIRQGVPPLFAAVLLAVSAALVKRGKGCASLPERVLTAFLGLFAVFLLGATVVALLQGQAGNDYYILLYRVIVMMFVPSGFCGVGLFALLLLTADAASDLRRLAASDTLTGALNRRGFDEAAIRAIANARRQEQPLSIVLADIDRFKQINDAFGHAAGDLALRRFSDEVVLAIRGGDVLARIGGEEFALLLVNASEDDAVEVVNRIRQSVAAMLVDAGDSIRLTASFGVTSLDPQDVSIADLLARADRALYQSKLGGRDRVTVLRSAPDASPLAPAQA